RSFRKNEEFFISSERSGNFRPAFSMSGNAKIAFLGTSLPSRNAPGAFEAALFPSGNGPENLQAAFFSPQLESGQLKSAFCRPEHEPVTPRAALVRPEGTPGTLPVASGTFRHPCRRLGRAVRLSQERTRILSVHLWA